MEGKNVKIILISLVVILALAAGAYWFGFARVKKTAPPVANSQLSPGQTQNKIQPNNTAPVKSPAKAFEGKVQSIREKVIYLEMTDGKTLVAKISNTVPVFSEGVEKAGNLTSLKVGATVVIGMDQQNNATQITIKK
jgi:hypothetical protein